MVSTEYQGQFQNLSHNKLKQINLNDTIRILIYVRLDQSSIQQEINSINNKYQPEKNQLKENIHNISSKYSFTPK